MKKVLFGMLAATLICDKDSATALDLWSLG